MKPLRLDHLLVDRGLVASRPRAESSVQNTSGATEGASGKREFLLHFSWGQAG